MGEWQFRFNEILLPFHSFSDSVSDFDFKFFDRYGRKNGFTCYVLRYFLVLNKDYNLNITMNEFMVAIATLFHKLELPRYQSLNIAPTGKCITMFNWLQVSGIRFSVRRFSVVGKLHRNTLMINKIMGSQIPQIL